MTQGAIKRAIVSQEVYARAEQFLPWNVEKAVYGLFVKPHWIGNTDRFWYRRRTRKGFEFLHVDPDAQTLRPAFDQEKVAESIYQATGDSCDPFDLPFTEFFFTKGEKDILFLYNNLYWRCDLQHYICSALDDSRIPQPDSLRSPNNRWDLSIEKGDLVIRSIGDGEQWKLTTDAAEGYTYATSPDSNLCTVTRCRQGIIVPPVALWSPDGTKVLTHRLDQRKVPRLHLLQHVPTDGSVRPQLYHYRYPFVGDRDVATQELLLFAIEAHSCLSLQTEPLVVSLYSAIEMGWVWWSKNGKKIYFLKETRGAKTLALCVADAESGEVRTVIEESSEEYVEPSQIVPWPSQVRSLETTEEILWLSERDGHAHLYLYDEKTGVCKGQVTYGPWEVIKVLHVDERTRTVYFLGCGRESHRDPYYPHCYRVNLDEKKTKLLTTAVAAHSVSFSPSKRYFVDNFSTINAETLPNSELLDSEGKKVLHLESANLKALFAKGWRPPERFTVKAQDGETPLYGMLFFPSHFDSHYSYPVIDWIYPGPHSIVTPKAFTLSSHEPGLGWPGPWLPQAFAELGCLVVMLDGRGTPLRSRRFHHYSYGDLGQKTLLEDHICAMKELASERTYMDLSRVGTIGHAAGGYAAVRALLLHPDFYKVGVASGGDHNVLSYLAYWGEKYQGLYEKERYSQFVNASFADRLQGHLLLAHGELDDNVHPCGTMQLVDALIQANKDFTFLYLPNENAMCYENPYFLRKAWDFFVRHLLEQEPPSAYRIQKPTSSVVPSAS